MKEKFNVRRGLSYISRLKISFRVLCIQWSALCVLWHAPLVFGAQWSIEPSLSTQGQFYDNLTLTFRPHHSVWATKVSPTVVISYDTEILNLNASPKFEYARYFSEDPIDETFNNYFLPLSGSYRTELDRFGLDGAINRDNAFFSELEDAGVATRFIQRDFRDVRGSWDRSVTERMTAQSSYHFTDVDYEKTGGSNLSDYQVHTGTLGAGYQWTEATDLNITGWYSNYHVPQNRFRSQAPGFELGFSHRMFETFSISGSGALRYVRTTLDQGGQKEKDTDLAWLFDVALDKKWERSHIKIGYSRALNPSGLGLLFVTDRINLVLKHQLTYALKVSLRGTFSNNETIGSSSDVQGVNTDRRRFWQIEPALSWRVTEDWSWDLSYSFATRKQSGETADSNKVSMGLTYTWPQWSVSR